MENKPPRYFIFQNMCFGNIYWALKNLTNSNARGDIMLQWVTLHQSITWCSCSNQPHDLRQCAGFHMVGIHFSDLVEVHIVALPLTVLCSL